jgi:phage tail sheath gpL-like
MSTLAVGSERVAKIVGYALTGGNFSETSPNLPQSIAIVAEANEANQSGLSTDPEQIITAQQAGELYGYGSPIHMIARILFPNTGDGVGGIPVFVYPQAKASGSAAKIFTVSPTGTATANGTHTIVIAGRSAIDGASYSINIESGDTAAEISQKIEDAINNALSCPMSATSTDYEATLTSKWFGLTANSLTVQVDTGGDDLGISYAINSTQSGSGTPTVTASLEKFGERWNTIVVNSYGLASAVVTELENFNGKPSIAGSTPTGRYTGTIFKPFVALSGSVADNDSSFTDAKKTQLTIAVCPAPLSKGHPMEAAANMCVLLARQAQNNPHLDVSGDIYPDMPTPTTIGTMSNYNFRDQYVKKGNSCVELVAGQYRVTDFVTTYHPDGEVPPQFRYVRSLVIDMNVNYGYYLLEQENVVDHAIAADSATVAASKVVKPKIWKAIVSTYAENLSLRGLTTDAPFMQNSIRVSISTTNPDRLETFFRYKRSGFTRIAASEAQAGFNFGTVTP